MGIAHAGGGDEKKKGEDRSVQLGSKGKLSPNFWKIAVNISEKDHSKCDVRTFFGSRDDAPKWLEISRLEGELQKIQKCCGGHTWKPRKEVTCSPRTQCFLFPPQPLSPYRSRLPESRLFFITARVYAAAARFLICCSSTRAREAQGSVTYLYDDILYSSKSSRNRWIWTCNRYFILHTVCLDILLKQQCVIWPPNRGKWEIERGERERINRAFSELANVKSDFPDKVTYDL